MLIKQPCAYCGTTTTIRTKGHVFSRALFPDNLPKAPRITVPECLTCKGLWDAAEPQFRNILVAIWNPEQLPIDSRAAKMWRSFEKSKRLHREFIALMKPVGNLDDGRYTIYPAEDEDFSLILRRIVRGLAHWHGFDTAITDSRVSCDVMRWSIPPAFERKFTWHTIATDFISYTYKEIDDQYAQSFWLIRFSKQILFFGYVAQASKG